MWLSLCVCGNLSLSLARAIHVTGVAGAVFQSVLGMRMRLLSHAVMRPSCHSVAHATTQRQQEHEKQEHKKSHGIDVKASSSA